MLPFVSIEHERFGYELKTMLHMNKIWLFAVIAGVIVSCSDPTVPPSEHISAGKLNIGVDHSYQPLMDTEIYTYTSLNAKAFITPTYMPEGDIFDLLMKDSIQAAVVGRALTEEEVAYFKSRDRTPESIVFAKDGVALILNPENKDTTLTISQVREIFQGVIGNWNGISQASTLGEIKIVFDHTKSNNARTIKEKLLDGKAFPSNVFAVQTNEEVIDYVSTHKNAMGVISLNWISDNADKSAQKFMEKIKVAGIIDPSNAKRPELARRPFQAYIFDGSYPLTREVYYIRTGLRGSIGTGFVNHLLSQTGQLIIDRIGMSPVTPPERVIKITQ